MRPGLVARRMLAWAATRLRGSDRATLALDLPYLDDGDPKHRLDLYLPREGGPHPVVLFVHGGFWRSQDRRYLPALTGLYGNVGMALAARGIAVAIPSYRLAPRVGIDEQIADVLAALRWTIERIAARGGDPSRVVLGGFSAGGHLVSLVTMDPTYLASAGIDAARIRGCVTLSGLLDVEAMERGQDRAFNEEVTYRLFGRTAEERARRSPCAHLRRDAPPLLAFAAEHDYPFVVAAGERVARELGDRAKYVLVPGIDHAEMVLRIDGPDDPVTERFAAFVRAVAG